MEYKMSSGQKLCGTCEYWVGSRQPDFYGSASVLPEQSTNGKCWCLNSPLARGDRFSNNSGCFCYKKWSALK